LKRILIVFVGFTLLLSLPHKSQGQNAASGLYQRANQAYQEGNFPEAIELYQQILSTGLNNSAVFYNLGNAYFKDNQLGRAILFYERAKRLLPRDQDVTANLALAHQLTVDRITTEEMPLFIGIFTWPARSMSIAELTWLSFILHLLAAALVIAVIWVRAKQIRKKILVVCLIVGILFVVFGASLLANVYHQRRVPRAIVLAPVADARSGPGRDYTKIFTVHEGTKIRIRQERESWYLISLPNGLAGWIPGDTAEII
jgi:tetratricopeptide (TPR) repeat protein